MTHFSKDELDFMRAAIDAVLRGSGLQFAAIASSCDSKISTALQAFTGSAMEGDGADAGEPKAGG